MKYMYVISRPINNTYYPFYVTNTREQAKNYIKDNYSDDKCVIDEVEVIYD